MGEHLGAHASKEFNIPGITLGARYDNSPLIVTDGSIPPVDNPNVYEPSASPGGRAPHAWLADGGSLYDAFGFGFTLMKLGAAAGSPEGVTRAARARQLPIENVELANEGLRGLYEADWALIRPDQVVCWRGDHLPPDPDELLDTVTGRR